MGLFDLFKKKDVANVSKSEFSGNLITKECDLSKEFFVFGTKCNKCGRVYIGELDAASLYPFYKKSMSNYYVVKGIKRALLIDRREFKCKCGNAGFKNFRTVGLLQILFESREGLVSYAKSLKDRFNEIKDKVQYF